MRIKDIKELIMEHIRPIMEENGFRSVKKDFAFIRKEKKRKCEIYYIYTTWGFEVHLYPKVSIDMYKIKEICVRCGFDLNYAAHINLLELEKIERDGFDSHSLFEMRYNEKDFILLHDEIPDRTYVLEAVDRLLPLALRYVDKYDSYEALDRLFNSDHIGIDNPNCNDICHPFIGMVVAKLTNNPDYEKLHEYYSQYIMTCDDEYKRSFKNLTDYLASVKDVNDL